MTDNTENIENERTTYDNESHRENRLARVSLLGIEHISAVRTNHKGVVRRNSVTYVYYSESCDGRNVRLRSLQTYPEGIECTEIDIVASTRLTVRRLRTRGPLNYWYTSVLSVFRSSMSAPVSCWQVVSPFERTSSTSWPSMTKSHAFSSAGRSGGGSRIHELRQVRRLRSASSFDEKYTDAQGEA